MAGPCKTNGVGKEETKPQSDREKNKETVFQLICGERSNAVKLGAFALLTLLGIYFISLFFLPCILSRIAAQTGGDVQISAGNSGVTLAVTSPRGEKTVKVINVPANRSEVCPQGPLRGD